MLDKCSCKYVIYLWIEYSPCSAGEREIRDRSHEGTIRLRSIKQGDRSKKTNLFWPIYCSEKAVVCFSALSEIGVRELI